MATSRDGRSRRGLTFPAPWHLVEGPPPPGGRAVPAFYLAGGPANVVGCASPAQGDGRRATGPTRAARSRSRSSRMVASSWRSRPISVSCSHRGRGWPRSERPQPAVRWEASARPSSWLPAPSWRPACAAQGSTRRKTRRGRSSPRCAAPPDPRRGASAHRGGPIAQAMASRGFVRPWPPKLGSGRRPIARAITRWVAEPYRCPEARKRRKSIGWAITRIEPTCSLGR